MAAPQDLVDDGLHNARVGDWALQKYAYVQLYAEMFSTSMKDHWDRRAYVDLFAGAGRARIRGTERIISTSPIRALSVPTPFDRYVFCEQNGDCAGALGARVEREFKGIEVVVVHGDSNTCTADILGAMPSPGRGAKVLAFCFVDPFRLRDLHFSTLEKLSARFVDFLILVPTGMDTARNASRYLNPCCKVVDEFLGDAHWRDRCPIQRRRGLPFAEFVADQLGQRLKSLKYMYDGLADSIVIHSTAKNLPLYRLMFFSRHRLGLKLWKESLRCGSPQTELNF